MSAALDQVRGRQRAAFASIRVLGAAAIAFVVIASFQAKPGPGSAGEALGVSLALIAFSAATVTAMWLTDIRPAVRLVVLLIAVISAVTLMALQPKSGAFLGVFPALGMAGLALPVGSSAVVLGVTVTALAVVWTWNGRIPVVGIALNEFGVFAIYLLSLLARRLGESNQRAEDLLAELEQTRAAQAQAAALAERQRLAREMHDVLAHALSGLVLNLEGARLLSGQSGADPQVGEAIERANRLARTGLDEARRAIGMLRGEALPGPERLADLAAEFGRDSGLTCAVTITGDQRDISADGRLTLYRVAQEALTNIRKHAKPERVELHVVYDPAGISLTVEDFGADGQQAPHGQGTGYGLTGMKERAELLGGTLTAGSTGGGFRVQLWVPA